MSQCNTLQHTATHCNTHLREQSRIARNAAANTQCVAVYCSVLHFVAVCCSVLQCIAVCCSVPETEPATHCNTLQHTATHCNTLQHTATGDRTCNEGTLRSYIYISHAFFDGYSSTVQGLFDWFEVDLGFTEVSFIQIDLCVLCVFVLYSCVSLSSCPFWTFCAASPARRECL